MALALVRGVEAPGGGREVLEFGCGVRAYEPPPGGRWRLRWVEAGRRRDTTVLSREEAVGRAAELVERLSRGVATDLARATGAELVAHFLDPARRPPKAERWSERHRAEMRRWCERHVLPEIAAVPCAALTRVDLQRVLDRASTASNAQHLRRCLTGLVAAGLEEGYLLARQDVMRGVRWRPPEAPAAAPPGDDGWWGDDSWLDDEDPGRAVTDAEVPDTALVHALAAAAAAASGPSRGGPGVWWRELEVLLVAYSGMRWGEHAALRADRVDTARRRIAVHRQLVEVGGRLQPALPKGRRRRSTVYPAVTPGGVDLAAMVERRVAEAGPGGLLFPSPRGAPQRRSNYGRNLWDPAAAAAGWPRRPDGRWLWTFHSLRHVFATWALAIGTPVEDVSKFLGHSSTRVTQDVYAHVHGDAHERFRQATQ
jgi:integrase